MSKKTKSPSKKAAKKSPKKATKKKATKKKTKAAAVTVDQDAKTVVDPRKPEDETGGKDRWRSLDRFLTVALVLGLLCLVLGVVGLNTWSQKLGAKGLHALTLSHVGQRSQAMIAYIKDRFGPPDTRRSSLGYEKEIQAAALRHQIPANLLKAVIRSSSRFRPRLLTDFGGVGLMSVTPSIASQMKVQGNLFRPHPNIRAGARFLRIQLKSYRNTAQALAAYHAKMRGKLYNPQHKDTPHARFARATLVELRRFQNDPGQEIRRASRTNRSKTPPKRFRLSWKRIKSMF